MIGFSLSLLANFWFTEDIVLTLYDHLWNFPHIFLRNNKLGFPEIWFQALSEHAILSQCVKPFCIHCLSTFCNIWWLYMKLLLRCSKGQSARTPWYKFQVSVSMLNLVMCIYMYIHCFSTFCFLNTYKKGFMTSHNSMGLYRKHHSFVDLSHYMWNITEYHRIYVYMINPFWDEPFNFSFVLQKCLEV